MFWLVWPHGRPPNSLFGSGLTNGMPGTAVPSGTRLLSGVAYLNPFKLGTTVNDETGLELHPNI